MRGSDGKLENGQSTGRAAPKRKRTVNSPQQIEGKRALASKQAKAQVPFPQSKEPLHVTVISRRGMFAANALHQQKRNLAIAGFP